VTTVLPTDPANVCDIWRTPANYFADIDDFSLWASHQFVKDGREQKDPTPLRIGPGQYGVIVGVRVSKELLAYMDERYATANSKHKGETT